MDKKPTFEEWLEQKASEAASDIEKRVREDYEKEINTVPNLTTA